MPKAQLDPAIIGGAPIEPIVEASEDGNKYLVLIGELSSKLEARKAEIDRLQAKKTIDDVRADMLEEYSKNVFWFVAFYCLSVGFILLLAGFSKYTGFHLTDTILSIIAGSTAISVIGLIGMTVSGLFGSSKKKAAKPSRPKRQQT